MKKNNKKGFTIVELVIVIAVIAILAAVLIPTFSSVIKKAKVNNDIQLVRNLNTALATDNKKHKTMQSALDAAAKFGYDVAKINASATDNEILWDSKNDVFCYLNTEKNALEYIPSSVADDAKLSVNSYLLWKISKTVDPTYSTYYTGDATTFTGENAITKGFDAGTTTGITAINYTNNGSAQEVVIRTNGGTLTVNAKAGATKEETDSIIHYGYAEELVGSQLGAFSYHENGSVGFAKVEKGHFVIENSGSVNVLYVTGTLTGETAVSIEKTDRGVVGSAYCTDDSVVGTSAGNVDLTKVTSTETEEFLKNDSLFRKEIDSNGVEWRLISTSNELKAYAEKVNAGLFCSSEDKFKLANDIDLSNIETWTPISSANKSNVAEQYNGHFDGNNKVIKNLNISNGTQFLGLFGYVYGPTIENVRLENSQIAGSKYIGSLVGYVNGDATIRNCSNDVTSKVTCTSSNSGGIVGVLNTGSNIVLDGLKNYATVSGTRPGGIVGDVTNSAKVTISNCENNGKILAGTGYAGGIVSAYQGGSLTIDNCTNNGILEGTYTGKMLGWMTSVQVLTIKNYSGEIDGSLLGAMDPAYARNISINNVSYFMNKLNQKKKFADMWNSKGTLDTAKMDRIIDFYKYAKTKNPNFKDYSETYWSLFQANVGFGSDWTQLLAEYNREKFQNESEYLTEGEFSSTAWRNVDLYVVGQ